MTNKEVRNRLMTKVADAENHYNKRMNEHCKHTYADPCKLGAVDEACVQEAIEYFHSITKDFPADDKDQYVTILIENLRRKFHRFLVTNSERKDGLKTLLSQASAKAQNIYTQSMTKAVSSNAVCNIGSAHDAAFTAAMKHFNGVEYGLGSDIKQEVMSELCTAINQQRNTFNRQAETKVDDAIKRAKAAAFDKYKSSMRQKAEASYLGLFKLEVAHDLSLQEALPLLTRLKMGSRTDREVESLKSDAAKLKPAFQQLSLERAVASFQQRKNLALAAYKQSMSQRQIRNLGGDEFKVVHTLCKAAAIKAFEESGPHDPVSRFNMVGQELLDQMNEFARSLLLANLQEDLARDFIRLLLR